MMRSVQFASTCVSDPGSQVKSGTVPAVPEAVNSLRVVSCGASTPAACVRGGFFSSNRARDCLVS